MVGGAPRRREWGLAGTAEARAAAREKRRRASSESAPEKMGGPIFSGVPARGAAQMELVRLCSGLLVNADFQRTTKEYLRADAPRAALSILARRRFSRAAARAAKVAAPIPHTRRRWVGITSSGGGKELDSEPTSERSDSKP